MNIIIDGIICKERDLLKNMLVSTYDYSLVNYDNKYHTYEFYKNKHDIENTILNGFYLTDHILPLVNGKRGHLSGKEYNKLNNKFSNFLHILFVASDASLLNEIEKKKNDLFMLYGKKYLEKENYNNLYTIDISNKDETMYLINYIKELKGE